MKHFIVVAVLTAFTPLAVCSECGESSEQENPCNLVDCIPNTRCIVKDGQAKCIPLDGGDGENGESYDPAPQPDCSTVRCKPPTTCVIRPKNRGCSDDCELETACVIVTNDSPPATQNCGQNEQYNQCGSACEPSCKNPKPEICTMQCVIGCQCKAGYFRDDSGQCVAKCSSTGGAGGCSGPNEEKKSCGTACEPTCSEPNPVCTRQCVVDVCQCKQAFIRDKKGGACISVDDCPKDPIKPCSELNCPYGSICELGRVICPFVPPCFTRQTRCVPNNSGPAKPYQDAAPASKLPLCSQFHCAKGTRCLIRCQPDDGTPSPTTQEPFNPCAATTCPVGSECRVKQVQCVRAPCDPVAECYTPPKDNRCSGQFETFKTCSSQCEPSCSNKSPICILSCGEPKCQCNSGFYRDASGKCVTENDCDSNAETNPY